MASIEKRGDSYRITASCGYKGNGRKVRKKTTWTPEPGMTERQIERELQRQAILFQERCQQGLVMSGSIKLDALAALWMEDYAKTQLAPLTIDRHKALLKRILPALGHLRADKIQPHHLLEFYKQLSEPGQNQKTGGHLSEETIMHHHGLISSMLGTAVKWGIIPSNPACRVKPPKIPHKNISSYDETQSVRLLDALQAEPLKYHIAVVLLLYSGMRRGELLGLEWQDISWDSGVICIKRVSQYINGTGIFTKEPKNAGSIRKITLPMNVMDMLKRYRIWQMEEQSKLGDMWKDTGRLFTREDGGYMHPDSLLNWFNKFLKRNKLPHISLHGLRHTSATVLITSGCDIRTVSQRLGHKRASTTLDRYTHAVESRDKAAADKLEELFSPAPLTAPLLILK